MTLPLRQGSGDKPEIDPMTAEEITKYLTELNDELRLMEIKGGVSLYGGAVMVLAFKARIATKDVDAIFYPTAEIRSAAKLIAHATVWSKHGSTTV